ncbi:Histone-lysine N-methyltransferase [Coemansia sp. RSA 2618]|nr:Histone-lysine N-methyltransferase [Coemansia sp. RSA 2618]
MGGERQHKERRSGRASQALSGKVSIGNLVDEGLLQAGNIVVCNNWPFSAVVTSTGTFAARWAPEPSTFVAGVGTEFMRAGFETPSAWATAVCRVMRAQARAQKQGGDRDEPSKAAPRGGKGAAGESRVAVNGWTACRVRIARAESNFELVRRLDSDGEAGSCGDTIEVPLDALRRELTLRMSRRTRTAASLRRSGGRQNARASIDTHGGMDLDSRNNSGSDDDTHNHIDDDDDDSLDVRRSSIELREISGAVDGLARRVESDLALGGGTQRRAESDMQLGFVPQRRAESDMQLGFVSQRRAAAAAADAISASVHLVAPKSKTLGSGALSADARKHMHSRKRKSIPDMSRHAKLSRVPTDDSSGDDAGRGHLDAATQGQLAYFSERAEALKRSHSELKALRYQRKQQLKRRIANALDLWLHQRTAGRIQRSQGLALGRIKPVSPMPSLAASPVAAGDSAFPVGLMAPGKQPDWALGVTRVGVPESRLLLGLPRLCAACGSAGSAEPSTNEMPGGMTSCSGCGDWYHGGCAAQPASRWFVCPACRVCAQCLDSTGSDLLQCADCGVHVHASCSAQLSAHPDGLPGAVREAGGHWVCDACISCAECGFTMAADISARGAEWSQRASWTHDFCVCGQCAQHIGRGKVCPECVATYANCRVGDSSMVCCDVCQFWVHASCDPALEPRVYDALITLEDEAYVCPRCCAAPDDRGVLESSRDASDTESDVIPWLPRCLRSPKAELVIKAGVEAQSDAGFTIKAESPADMAATPPSVSFSEPDSSSPEMTEEAANLLLSLTRSDVRFGYDRFAVDALEQRFCTLALHTRRGGVVEDWRMCALCGLHGDGTQALAQTSTALGRLVPLQSVETSESAKPVLSTKTTESIEAAHTVAATDIELVSTQWAHVECLAWAWGPRAACIDSSWMRFEGALLDNTSDGADPSLGDRTELPTCTLCERANASFHCCAPVACYDTAFHLPCLLLAGSPSPHVTPDKEQYCVAWRRALCAEHAPMFSAMMPADGAFESQSYEHVRVLARVDNTGLDVPSKSNERTAVMVGSGLVVLGSDQARDDEPASDLRYVRVFTAAGQDYTLGVEAELNDGGLLIMWRGWIRPGVAKNLAARIPHTASASSLAKLLALLFDQVPRIAASSPLASVLVKSAVADPLRFLGLSRPNP